MRGAHGIIVGLLQSGTTHHCPLLPAAAADPSRINAAAQVGVQAAELTDELLQRFCAQHQQPSLVEEIDLHNSSQVRDISCLGVFVQLRELELDGCHQIEVASLVAVLGACLQLRVDVGGFLLAHGRVEEALDYRKQELKEAQQSGELCELE